MQTPLIQIPLDEYVKLRLKNSFHENFHLLRNDTIDSQIIFALESYKDSAGRWIIESRLDRVIVWETQHYNLFRKAEINHEKLEKLSVKCDAERKIEATESSFCNGVAKFLAKRSNGAVDEKTALSIVTVLRKGGLSHETILEKLEIKPWEII